MKDIRAKVLEGELQIGVFNHLGSVFATEITAKAGFDFILMDLEHGLGDRTELALQVIALEAYPSASLARVPGYDPVMFKRVLDLGVDGLMIPNVEDVVTAEAIVRATRYPPEGTRGVASLARCSAFGLEFEAYFGSANQKLLVIAQIESLEGIRNMEAIAAVPGIDGLFAGPLDLSVCLGIPRQFDHPDLAETYARLIQVCQRQNKVAGIHAVDPLRVDQHLQQGFRFITVASDGQILAREMKKLGDSMAQWKSNGTP